MEKKVVPEFISFFGTRSSKWNSAPCGASSPTLFAFPRNYSLVHTLECVAEGTSMRRGKRMYNKRRSDGNINPRPSFIPTGSSTLLKKTTLFKFVCAIFFLGERSSVHSSCFCTKSWLETLLTEAYARRNERAVYMMWMKFHIIY